MALIEDIRIRYLPLAGEKKAVVCDLASDVITCYTWVFGGSPWNEGWKCTNCKSNGSSYVWPLDSPPAHGSCPKCSGLVVPYWPASDVLADLHKQMQNPHAVCVVATQDGKPGVVGGTWGYALRPSRVQRTTGHEKIAEFLNRRYPEEGHVAYQDEIFVLERLWSNGIGKRLFRARYRKLAMAGLKVFVARTKRASPAYRWYLGMNYSVACEYEDGRVIMVAHRDDMPFVDLTDEADPDQ